MPALQNARREQFALAIARGVPVKSAHEQAGYRPHGANAYKLREKPDVRRRVAELQRRVRMKTETTIESLVEELEQARAAAAAVGQPAAMVQATIGKAKLLGLMVEKREDVTPVRSPQQVDAELRRFLERGGPGEAGEPAEGTGDGDPSDPAAATVSGHGTA